MVQKTLKYVFITIMFAGICYVVFLLLSMAVFIGVFDKNYTNEELIENFYEHEAAFEEMFRLVEPFSKAHPNFSIYFSNAGNEKVNFTAYSGKVYNGQKEYWGGSDLGFQSLEIKALLEKLVLTQQNLQSLSKAMEETQCEFLHIHLGRINLRYGSSGRKFANYRIYSFPIQGGTYGRPIGDTGFANQVVVDVSVGDATTY